MSAWYAYWKSLSLPHHIIFNLIEIIIMICDSLPSLCETMWRTLCGNPCACNGHLYIAWHINDWFLLQKALHFQLDTQYILKTTHSHSYATYCCMPCQNVLFTAVRMPVVLSSSLTAIVFQLFLISVRLNSHVTSYIIWWPTSVLCVSMF